MDFGIFKHRYITNYGKEEAKLLCLTKNPDFYQEVDTRPYDLFDVPPLFDFNGAPCNQSTLIMSNESLRSVGIIL